ncbi:MAG: aminoacyl-tRNA hydrolase [Planctomyces sp.]|nr:aminoacyl-tRNA hydrolase [Planctomyces sp.]
MTNRTEELVVADSVRIPFSEFEFVASRSSGPGGQNVNKVNSRIQLRWSPVTSPSISPEVAERFIRLAGRKMTNDGVCVITGQQFRDAPKNREDCLNRLAELLRSALHRPKVRKSTKPSRGSKERRLKAKRQRAGVKRDRQAPRDE